MRRPRSRLRLMAAAAVLCVVWGPTAPALAEETEDPNLSQSIVEGQEIVHGPRVLTEGHVDLGPRVVDGRWDLLVHDDVAKADAKARSVWRYPDETVFHITDAALLPVPDDPSYSFVGAPAGDQVWVVPQTQNPKVVWIGWNTQDPEVMQRIDRGITLSLTGVQGPGVLTTYLQSGNFGKPQLLWDSRVAQSQSVWVDVNTHTHANWVFTKPGVYLVQLEASATLIDGSAVSSRRVFRFAVGTDTSPQDALAAAWAGATAAPQPSPSMAAAGPAEPAPDPLVPILSAAIAVVSLTLLIGFGVALVRGQRARRAVLAARRNDAEEIGDGE